MQSSNSVTASDTLLELDKVVPEKPVVWLGGYCSRYPLSESVDIGQIDGLMTPSRVTLTDRSAPP